MRDRCRNRSLRATSAASGMHDGSSACVTRTASCGLVQGVAAYCGPRVVTWCKEWLRTADRGLWLGARCPRVVDEGFKELLPTASCGDGLQWVAAGYGYGLFLVAARWGYGYEWD